MDPITCCLLGICCPPGSPEQLEAFTKALEASGISAEKAKAVADSLRADLVVFSVTVLKAVRE